MARGRGFTLIEVLVTVAIIALLIAIAVPSMSAAKRISRRTVCLHNLEQIRKGLITYLNVNKDYFPYLCRMPSIEVAMAAAATPTREPYVPMPIGLARELGKNSKVFECPADIVGKIDPTPPVSPTLVMGGTYYESEKTSYEWTDQINGLHRYTKKIIYRTNTIPPTELTLPLADFPVVADFEAFHGTKTQRGSLNTLYANLEEVGAKGSK